MPELQEALAIEPGARSLNRDNISEAEDIVQACGSLVDHNKDTDNITFSHELVRKYVEDHNSELLLEQSEIALSCVTYLLLPVFDKPCTENVLSFLLPPSFPVVHKPRSENDVSKREREFALSVYACSFWGDHIRETKNERNVEVEVAVFDAFRSEDRCNAILETQRVPDFVENFGTSLIHLVCRERIGFILTMPLPDNRITTG